VNSRQHYEQNKAAITNPVNDNDATCIAASFVRQSELPRGKTLATLGNAD